MGGGVMVTYRGFVGAEDSDLEDVVLGNSFYVSAGKEKATNKFSRRSGILEQGERDVGESC